MCLIDDRDVLMSKLRSMMHRSNLTDFLTSLLSYIQLVHYKVGSAVLLLLSCYFSPV
jgi:hypothetical protein